MNLSDLFTYTDETYRLTLEQEVEAIRDAKAGDPEATEALLRQYGPTIRATVNRAKKTLDEDEAQSVALLAFAEVLESHDLEDEDYPDARLAPRLTPHLKNRLGEAQAAAESFTIPKRTLTRFFSILRDADGDVEVARASCETKGMSPEVFDAILQARSSGSLSDTLSDDTRDRIETATPIYGSREEEEIEDRLLVEIAFRAVDDEEARIVELAYGFRGTEDYAAGDPVPDAAIAPVVGLTRPTVQRRRAGALDKMRKATGAVPENG